MTPDHDPSSQTSKPETPLLVPHLVCAGAAEAIEFYKAAFGAIELMRLPGPDGKLMHACIALDGAQVMLVDEMAQCGVLSPRTLGGTPVTINLRVADVDAVFGRAVQAGAKPVMPPADMFWGDRYGVLEDPSGHRWAVLTPQRQLSEAELRDAAARFMQQQQQPEAVTA